MEPKNCLEAIEIIEFNFRNNSNTLPKVSQNWWQSHVLEKLTFQQQNFACNLPADSLEQLDLSALLRIADQNWFEISQQANINKDARNWLKEAMTIRNRWAHAPAEGLDEDTQYRDIDTLERLLQSFGSSVDDLKVLSQCKKILIGKLAKATGVSAEPQAKAAKTAVGYKPGTVVRLKAHPATTGAIIAHLPGKPEDRYQVFHDEAVVTYYASQIEPADLAAKLETVSPDALHAILTSFCVFGLAPLLENMLQLNYKSETILLFCLLGLKSPVERLYSSQR